MLSCHPLLDLQSGHFPTVFLTKILSPIPASPALATYQVHHPLHNFTILTVLGDVYKQQSYLLFNNPNCSPISSFLGPHVFLSTLVSETCNLYPSLKVRDISYPHNNWKNY